MISTEIKGITGNKSFEQGRHKFVFELNFYRLWLPRNCTWLSEILHV